MHLNSNTCTSRSNDPEVEEHSLQSTLTETSEGLKHRRFLCKVCPKARRCLPRTTITLARVSSRCVARPVFNLELKRFERGLINQVARFDSYACLPLQTVPTSGHVICNSVSLPRHRPRTNLSPNIKAARWVIESRVSPAARAASRQSFRFSRLLARSVARWNIPFACFGKFQLWRSSNIRGKLSTTVRAGESLILSVPFQLHSNFQRRQIGVLTCQMFLKFPLVRFNFIPNSVR